MKRFLIVAGLFLLLNPMIGRGYEGGNTIDRNPVDEITGSSADLKVFPNPVQNKSFNIELGNDKILEIRISNIAGSMVYRKTLPAPAEKYQVFTDNIPNGIYLLKIITANHISKTVKLLISNK
jgi:hypothetical protein